MSRIMFALPIGGIATAVLLWTHGPLLALLLAPVGASLLALLTCGLGLLTDRMTVGPAAALWRAPAGRPMDGERLVGRTGR